MKGKRDRWMRKKSQISNTYIQFNKLLKNLELTCCCWALYITHCEIPKSTQSLIQFKTFMSFIQLTFVKNQVSTKFLASFGLKP